MRQSASTPYSLKMLVGWPQLLAVVLLQASLSSVFPATLCEAVDLDMVDLDANLDLDNLRFHMNSDRHRVTLELEEHVLPDVPVFSVDSEQNAQRYTFSEESQTARLFRDPERRSSLVVTEDNGVRQVRGFIADNSGHLVIEPANADIRQKREAGNWHVVSRRQMPSAKKFPDVLKSNDSRFHELDDALERPLQSRAQAGPVEKWVEMLGVADYDLYEWFRRRMGESEKANDKDTVVRNMKLYLSQLISEVDDKYKASFRDDPDVRINIRLVGLVIFTEPGKCPWVEDESLQIKSRPVDEWGRKTYYDIGGIDAFLKWLQTFKAPVEYDFAFHFTGRNPMSVDGTDVAGGRTYVGKVCDKQWGGGSCETTADFEEMHYLAHEIGHTLGSQHDSLPEYPDATPCPADDAYIMGPTYPYINLQNRFVLSSCSKVQIKKILALPSKQCLNNPASNELYTADTIAKYLGGQLYSYSDRCKYRFGPTSTPYTYDYLAERKLDICTGIYCHMSTPEWYRIWDLPGFFSPKGTPCGDGKWCMSGKCVVDSRAPKGECYLGDTAYPTYDILANEGRVYDCPSALGYLMRLNRYKTVTDVCSNDASFKRNCCRMCGVPGGISSDLRNSLINPAVGATTTAATTASTTPTPKTTAITMTTPKTTTPKATTAKTPTTTPRAACQDDSQWTAYCNMDYYKQLCFKNHYLITTYRVEDICRATCKVC